VPKRDVRSRIKIGNTEKSDCRGVQCDEIPMILDIYVSVSSRKEHTDTYMTTK
jgi:hypothetical protein